MSFRFKHPHFQRDHPELLSFIPTPAKTQQTNFPSLPLQKHLLKNTPQLQHQQDLSAWHQQIQERELFLLQYDLLNKQRQPAFAPSYPDQLRQQQRSYSDPLHLPQQQSQGPALPQQQSQGPATADRPRHLSSFPNNHAAAPSAMAMPSLIQAAMPSACIAGVGATTALAPSPCGGQTSEEV